jgi:hypothetical protein
MITGTHTEKLATGCPSEAHLLTVPCWTQVPSRAALNRAASADIALGSEWSERHGGGAPGCPGVS